MSKKPLLTRVFERFDPRYRREVQEYKAEMDKILTQIDNGTPVQEVTIRLITEKTLEWDRELQEWTIATRIPIAEDKKLAILEGRGGAPLEEARRGRELVKSRSNEHRYVINFPHMESE